MSDDLNQQIGRLEAHVENLHRDMSDLKQELRNISSMMNRWKGAGALLALIGVVFGFFVDMAFKLVGR
jgi:tetrahydromethanopterin S-methyltransferase subunit B